MCFAEDFFSFLCFGMHVVCHLSTNVHTYVNLQKMSSDIGQVSANRMLSFSAGLIGNIDVLNCCYKSLQVAGI